MPLLLLLAVPLSLLIGIGLGVLGGGGSILTVPLLVYVLGVPDKAAIAASLFVVGVTSAVAAWAHARAGNVSWRTSLVFAVGGMSGAFVGGRLAQFVPATWLLAVFATIMLAAAFFMWRGRSQDATTKPAAPLPLLLLQGLVIGSVTGLVGAGGGFLIVPALALSGGLSMPRAVGSSLVVIALQSFAGFAGHIGHVQVPWTLTLAVTGTAVAGSFLGAAWSKRISPTALRKGFAVFIVIMAAFILSQQLPALFG